MARPLKYQSVEELEQAIDEYFDSNPDNPTQSGLALHLGFSSRKSLYNYKDREQFLHTIKKAFLRIDCQHEKRLYEHGNTGSIFYLKNRGWSDSIDLTSKGEKITGSPIIVNSQGEEPDVE